MASFVRRLARTVLPHEVRRRLRDDLGVGAASSEADNPPAQRRGSRVPEVRDLMNDGDVRGATSLAAALAADPDTAKDGAVALGLLAHRRGARRLAWQQFRKAPLRLRLTQALTEYVNTGIVVDPDTLFSELEGLVERQPRWMRPHLWARAWEATFGAGRLELADRMFAILDEALGPRKGEVRGLQGRRTWAIDWVGREVNASAPRSEGADVSFAIVDYGHPGRFRASCNIGDHVQTLSSLGHLVRHQDLSFAGDSDLVSLLQTLQGRVRPERQRTGLDATVHVQTVARDATMYDRVPEDTWVLAFGWYMHALAPERYGLPLHDHLNPVFLSFHCNQRGLLTPEVVEYLKAHGPIGCRDWTTVYILLSLDVPAFFSGCLTTTVNTVFPDVEGAFPADKAPGYVDVKDAPEGATTYKQGYDSVRVTSFEDNIRDAVELLETYRREHSKMVTSRLHCYLPSRSLGATVDFHPKNLSDIRFAGLNPLDDAQFDAIRDGILDKLERLFTSILSGRSTEEVYADWGDITRDAVAEARERFAAPPTLAVDGSSHDLPLPVAEGVDPAATQVVVHGGSHTPAAVLRRTLDSLAEHASGRVQVWVLDERGSLEVPAGSATERDGVDVATLDVTPLHRALAHPGRGGAERFATTQLDQLLPGADRVVVIPSGALVLGDVAELAGLDLGGEAFAAPRVPTSHDSGFGMIHAAGDRLAERTDLSEELRRTAHQQHAWDFTAFDIDLMVIDLERWRADDWSGRIAARVRDYGLTDREALHHVAGPHRAEVPDRWRVVPTRMPLEDPALVHWADAPRPWEGVPTPAGHLWG